MLHLIPVKGLLIIALALFGLAVVAASYGHYIGTGDFIGDAKIVTKWASYAATASIVLSCVAWRFLPFADQLIFPYLGGTWKGVLQFATAGTVGSKEVRLKIEHSIWNVKLILSSDESTSRTLVVHAERDKGIQTDRIYYVYANERREGAGGASTRFKGLATLRIEGAKSKTLVGEYFTEQGGRGTLNLTRVQKNSPIVFWQ